MKKIDRFPTIFKPLKVSNPFKSTIYHSRVYPLPRLYEINEDLINWKYFYKKLGNLLISAEYMDIQESFLIKFLDLFSIYVVKSYPDKDFDRRFFFGDYNAYAYFFFYYHNGVKITEKGAPGNFSRIQVTVDNEVIYETLIDLLDDELDVSL